MAAAMKKKGVGLFAPKKLSDALAKVCGVKTAPRTEAPDASGAKLFFFRGKRVFKRFQLKRSSYIVLDV